MVVGIAGLHVEHPGLLAGLEGGVGVAVGMGGEGLEGGLGVCEVVGGAVLLLESMERIRVVAVEVGVVGHGLGRSEGEEGICGPGAGHGGARGRWIGTRGRSRHGALRCAGRTRLGAGGGGGGCWLGRRRRLYGRRRLRL